jgi:4-carboxymuconolactone decarboxylase
MRLTEMTKQDLDRNQRVVFDEIEQGPRGRGRTDIGLSGPFGVFVRQPGIGGPAQALGAAIRFQSGLPENIKEVAICTVGAFHRARFEFAAHQQLALQAGVDEACLEQLRTGEAADFVGDEAVAHRIASQLLNEHRIEATTYADGQERFGEHGMIEIVMTVGYYCLISHTLNAFEIPLSETMVDPFPEVLS